MLIINGKKHRIQLVAVASLVLIVLIVALRNYVPGTWLSGWDNLHTEFNFPLNVYRSVYAVWQEYQGLGLLGGMGHASDLVRELFLWAASMVIQPSLIRYFYHFLMLLVGVLGIYTVLYTTFLASISSKKRIVIAWLASIFYLVNLGTIQYFFTPFEPYSTFWGFFPWEIFVLLRFLNKPSRKNLTIFAIVNLLATPQAYVQTIFLVYLMCVGVFIGAHLLSMRTKWAFFNGSVAVVVIFLVNAFWLLPQLYFVKTNVAVTTNAVQNKSQVEKFFQQNKRRGTLADFVLMREYNFDAIEIDKVTQKPTYLMTTWIEHYAVPLTRYIGYGVFITALFGIVVSKKYRLALGMTLSLCAFGLMSDEPIVSLINNLIRVLPLVNQVFRNPFSKFIVPTIFVFSVGFALGLSVVLEALTKRSRELAAFVCAGIIVFFAWMGYPLITGNLFSPSVRVVVPHEYFALFNFFSTADQNGRIANLPQTNYWGWESYSWGSRGSGFIWYGIAQPIMDRAFDVWNNELEAYYWELHYALNSNSAEALNRVLNKYAISYVLFDRSFLPSDTLSVKYLLKEEDLLQNNPQTKLVFSQGSLSVYRVMQNQPIVSNIGLLQNTARVLKKETYSNEDRAFATVGTYQNMTSRTENSLTVPFESLFSGRFQNEHSYNIQSEGQSTVFSTSISPGTYTLKVPSIMEIETKIPVALEVKKIGTTLFVRTTVQEPALQLGETKIAQTAITQEVSFAQIQPDASKFVLSINALEYLPFALPTEVYTKIGTVYLNRDVPNYVRLFDITGKRSVRTVLTPVSFNNAHDCVTGQVLENRKAIESNGIQLSANSNSVCADFGQSFSVQKLALAAVNFTYRSQDAEIPQYCYFNTTSDTCLNKKDSSHFGFSQANRSVTEFFEVPPSSNNAQSFQFILNPDGDIKDTARMWYGDGSIDLYPNIGISIIDLGPYKDVNGYVYGPITVTKTSTFSATLPLVHDSLVPPEVISSHLYADKPALVSELYTGEAHTERLADPADTMRLFAKDNYITFALHFPNINLDTGVMMSVDVRNDYGFPLGIDAVGTTEKQRLISTKADLSKKFLTHTFIIPPLDEFSQGLDLYFFNESVNHIPTVNDVRAITLQEIPYRYLTSITLQKGAEPTSPQKLVPVAVTKKNISEYMVSVPNSNTTDQTLVLYQAYNPGWHAYLGGTELKEHVKINNWANGWTLRSSSFASQGKPETSSVVVIYLPQYLEFAGFVLLGLTIVLILRFRNP